MASPKNYKILLVEDEPDLVSMYQLQFQKAGYTLLVAKSTEEGLNLALSHLPHLILLDIILPKKEGLVVDLETREGYDFLKKVKENPLIKNIPVIIFTNLDTPQDRQKARALGASDYWIKADFVPREVVEKVEKFLGEANK